MQWIKHDTDANQDAKLQNVLLDYGLEGYGLYWYCMELIAGKVDANNITFELEHDARIIARNAGSTPQKVEEMMRYFVEIGLFENSNNTITCLKLAKRLTQSMTSNPQMREIIKNFKSHDTVMTQSDSIMQDKIRLDEIKEEKKKPVKRFAPPSLKDVLDYMTERGYPYPNEAESFIDYYSSNGWKVGRNQMKDWKAATRNWTKKLTKKQPVQHQMPPADYDPLEALRNM
ncbi:protein of unknown function DUF4373 [Vibrio phage 1.236.O._10N.261.52.C4]|nr:protein of unknown function DUF4373 [Vibrio phage 1.236.O._10N.261.52.C4]